MTAYLAPTRDMRFVIEQLAGLDDIASLETFAEAEVGVDLVDAVLEESGRLAAEVLAPLNKPGDSQGARLVDGRVIAAEGFKDAYQQFVDGGWNGLSAPAEYDGQGLPELIGTAVHEMWQAANMSFALCPMLTAGAIESLKAHGSDDLKDRYLARMISGEWPGTMNLTEPAAGSDLSAVRSRAVPEGDHYRLSGQKIYITWGDHDLTDNIVHLVLARLPDAPEGVRGISLFLVPQILVDDDGSLGMRNDIRCVSIEHKMGIHASPTCTLALGDNGGAIGYLVGQPNKGLACMFTMMNEARLKVGLQGLAQSDRAYQQALGYARDRIQGRPAGQKDGDRVAIIEHPDVRRMLMMIRSQVEAMRAVCYTVAAAMDLSHHHPDAEQRRYYRARVDLMTPVVKGWCTELGVELTSLGVQVHGGMGYVEETGACQYFRDARIATIYEGTTGIQAADLVGRKVVMDQGEAMMAMLDEMRATVASLTTCSDPHIDRVYRSLAEAVDALDATTGWLLTRAESGFDDLLSGSVDYLMLVGYVCGGWQMARAALIARDRLAAGDDPDFYRAKQISAVFYAERVLPKALALARAVQAGGESVMTLTADQF